MGLVFYFIITCLCSLLPPSFRCACRLLSFQVLAAATTQASGYAAFARPAAAGVWTCSPQQRARAPRSGGGHGQGGQEGGGEARPRIAIGCCEDFGGGASAAAVYANLSHSSSAARDLDLVRGPRRGRQQPSAVQAAAARKYK